MKNFLIKLWRDDGGAEMVEWAIVVGLVVVGAIAAYQLMGSTVQTAVSKVATALSDAVK